MRSCARVSIRILRRACLRVHLRPLHKLYVSHMVELHHMATRQLYRKVFNVEYLCRRLLTIAEVTRIEGFT